MFERSVFFVSTGGYEVAWQAVSMGLTSAAMGEAVVFVFAFDALRTLVSGHFGQAGSEQERTEIARGAGLGAATPASMLEDARGLGARLVACDTTVRLCGFAPAELEAARTLDEVLGLPQIWRLTQGARVLTF
jgi:peroxiredoxin family protein